MASNLVHCLYPNVRKVDRDWLFVATDDVAERNESDKERDDELCRDFLAGSAPAPESPEEKKARAALARRIRDQMPVSLTRELLALAIDPDTKSPLPNMVATRKIKFENPASGHPSEWRRDSEIRNLIKKLYLPEEADKAIALALKERARVIKSYKEIGREPTRSEQRRLDKMIKRARTGRGVLEAVYARAMKAHGISRRTAQRIWRGK